MKHQAKKQHSDHGKHTSHEPPRRPRNDFWKYATYLFAILFITTLITDGFDFRSKEMKTSEDLNSISMKLSEEGDKNILIDAIKVLNSITGESYKEAESDNEGEKAPTEGKVIIEEFSDFECPYCSRAVPTVEEIKKTYGDKVEVVFKNFPLGFHKQAQGASEAAECARDQGNFWEYHDKLFDNQGALSTANYKVWAEELGLDMDKFNLCVDNNEKADIVAKDLKEGQQKGVSGTPTFFVNGRKLVGAQPFAAFKPIIDAAIGGEAPSAPEPSAPVAPTAPNAIKVSMDDDPVEGDENAPVTIIEFSDYECPFCSRFYTQTLGQIRTEYIETGKVKLVFRDFPLGFHAEAKPAAIAANCADKQGKFWEYHDKIFENQGLIGTSNYNAWAEELELDMDAYVECLVDPEVAAEIEADLQDGAAARNSGTPGFFIGVSSDDGTIEAVQVVGSQPFAAFKSAIDQKLAEAAK
ncbi:thioredoxin domain-containing protein [archaeon]|nr:thioredoxin domain-containing protein [archaeon]MBT4647758.1 thioredoxin domain-containing protein [archaeon]MBT6821619.1 thioredoxin domain-containing protein [archaeon]MBT7391853.1 thioredoxin domain-containing protein [archaeon]